ncbi:MAG: hypothetical protein HON09_02385 [Flavobacteriaceae bacterium]|nr:hypothetical protein [Flavobacteriaceae bacterium]
MEYRNQCHTAIIAPRKIPINALFKITRFIDCKDRKYSRSLNFPIPGFTALDQVKKIPAINPVNSIAEARIIVSVFITYIN